MSKLCLFARAWAAFLLLLPFSLLHATPVDVPFPEGVQVHIVSEQMEVNGLPLFAYEFKDPGNGDETLSFYRDYWRKRSSDSDAPRPFLEKHVPGWKILSRLEDGHNITVQVGEQSIDGSQVLVGISPLPRFLEKDRKVRTRPALPELGRARILSIVASGDHGKNNETYWMESPDSIEETLDYYVAHYREKGYTVRKKRAVRSISNITENALMVAEGPGAHIRMDVFTVEETTHVIASYSRK